MEHQRIGEPTGVSTSALVTVEVPGPDASPDEQLAAVIHTLNAWTYFYAKPAAPIATG
jgi:hypothetical protein